MDRLRIHEHLYNLLAGNQRATCAARPNLLSPVQLAGRARNYHEGMSETKMEVLRREPRFYSHQTAGEIVGTLINAAMDHLADLRSRWSGGDLREGVYR